LVDYNNTSFQPSSPFRHATELSNILNMAQYIQKSILFLYCDDGRGHRLTYVSVQLLLIPLFLQLDLDLLCIARTAPSHSCPLKFMATLNLGIQCIGLMKDKMDDMFEEEVAKCNSLTTLREREKRGFKDAVRQYCTFKMFVEFLDRTIGVKGKEIHNIFGS